MHALTRVDAPPPSLSPPRFRAQEQIHRSLLAALLPLEREILSLRRVRAKTDLARSSHLGPQPCFPLALPSLVPMFSRACSAFFPRFPGFFPALSAPFQKPLSRLSTRMCACAPLSQ
eukprot:6196794-Pleurochrysis_carterae.AAC.1